MIGQVTTATQMTFMQAVLHFFQAALFLLYSLFPLSCLS